MGRQPDPQKGRQSVPEQALEWFNEMSAEAVRRGIETYGGELETFNGRDPLMDGQEEIVDAYAYMSQARMEARRLRLLALILIHAIGCDDECSERIKEKAENLREALAQSGLGKDWSDALRSGEGV